MLILLRFYQKFISPLFVVFFGHSCRFTPTCSEYSKQAIEKYGIMRGIFMSVKRIIRCNPFSRVKYDPVI